MNNRLMAPALLSLFSSMPNIPQSAHPIWVGRPRSAMPTMPSRSKYGPRFAMGLTKTEEGKNRVTYVEVPRAAEEV